MPKSKRDKKVTLTRTKTRPLESKQALIEEVQKCLDSYSNLCVINVGRIQNNKLKEIRQEWKESRFFFGKNKLMALALGKSETDEYRPKLHLISKHLVGQRGLLFTNRNKDEVLKWFNTYTEQEYARSGDVATESVLLDKGGYPFLPHSLEPQLRQWGLPTSLQKGVITLIQDHKLCSEGEELTPEQARLLKVFGKKLADINIEVTCTWNNTGTFQVY